MNNEELRKYIGKKLQTARKNGGYRSASAYAEHMEINPSTYTSYEQGIAPFTIEQAWLFAVDLGIDVNTLIGFETTHTFSDPNQEALNNYYESMNSQGRETLLNSAKLMSGSPDTRIEKDSEKCVGISA